MNYQQVHFLVSAARLSQAPEDLGAEVAFAGRSNAGKSSAINTITNIGELARTSKTPGRTQLMNFFRLDDQRRLVDLPGYGYAKVAESVKRRWQAELSHYLHARQSLVGLILLMDIRHPLKAFDLQMLQWCRQCGLTVHILLTKSDKLKRGQATRALAVVREYITAHLEDTTVQLFSATKRVGVDEVRRHLDGWFN